MVTIEQLKFKMLDNKKLLEKDPDYSVNITYNTGLDDETISMYESRIGYRLPDEFKHFYKVIDGLTIEKNNEKFDLWSLEDIYDKLKYNQKNDIYLHGVLDGYHVQIGEHPQGSLIMNVNGADNYLYISHHDNKEWLGIKDLEIFFNNFSDCFFTPFWKDIQALQYFDKSGK